MANWDAESSDFDDRFIADPYGVFLDPKTGKSYAEVDYWTRGGRKGFFSGRRKLYKTDIFNFDPANRGEWRKYKEKLDGKLPEKGRGSRYKSDDLSFQMSREKPRRGLFGYSVGYPIGTSPEEVEAAKEEKNEAYNEKSRAYNDMLKRKSDWRKETTLGSRGKARKAFLDFRAESRRAYEEARDRLGSGWGY